MSMATENQAFENGKIGSSEHKKRHQEDALETDTDWGIRLSRWSTRKDKSSPVQQTKFTNIQDEIIAYSNKFDTAIRNGFHSHSVFHEDLPPKSRRAKKLHKLSQRRREYTEEFTVHGLTKACFSEGIEKIFWVILQVVVWVCLLYLLYISLRKRGKNHIFHHNQRQSVQALPYPSITLCIGAQDISKYHICQNNASTHECSQSVNLQPPTLDVLKCRAGQHDCMTDFQHNTGIDNTCATFNPQGRVAQYLPGLHNGVEMLINDTYYGGHKKMRVFLHNFTVASSSMDHEYHLLPPGMEHYMELKRFDHYRIPKCVASDDDNQDSFFPGQYTAQGCYLSHQIQDMCKSCGIVYDRYDRWLPDNVRKENARDTSASEKVNCIKSYNAQLNSAERVGKPSPKCYEPCYETTYSALIHSAPASTIAARNGTQEHQNAQYFLSLYYTKLEYLTIEEVKDYDSVDVAASLGGHLGLITGASIISGVEIVIYLVLRVTEWYYERKK